MDHQPAVHLVAAVSAGISGDRPGAGRPGLFHDHDLLALVGGAAVETAQEKPDVRNHKDSSEWRPFCISMWERGCSRKRDFSQNTCPAERSVGNPRPLHTSRPPPQ